jgi:Tfp pilus assembly protein PilX
MIKRLGRTAKAGRQQGIVLIVAIIAILVMTFAVLAMLRSSSGSLGIAGNLAFKKNATAAGDLAVEAARSWLITQTSISLASNQAPGYFATGMANFDPTTYAWSAGTNAIEATADDGAGNRVLYVIHRLCSVVGSFNLPNQTCVRPSSLNSAGAGSAIGSGGGGGGVMYVVPRPYFRVTTRIEGPRNTLSYVQVIMY